MMLKNKLPVKIALLAIAALILASGIFIVYKIYGGNYNIWLSDYLFNQQARNEMEGTVDIIFICIDHWEPGCRVPEKNLENVQTWMTGFRQLADKHIDSDGKKLQHTFFYPLEQFVGYQVDSLVQLCADGYGDVEVHLHHFDDTPATLREKLSSGIDSLKAHGAMISPDGQSHFAFVHGNWALDNSRQENDRNYCGVNREIEVLLDLGCFADYTFPALNSLAQPSMVNKIYYARDDNNPKSYDKGITSYVGIEPSSDMLMMFTGPMMINWSDWRFRTHPTIDDGDLYADMLPDIDRFDLWLKADVHITDGPNWVFVRPHTHGCNPFGGIEANLGPAMDRMLTEVEEKYRDNDKYRLHYMTAREAYNVAKAAEAGKSGNPDDYRDYIIKPYLYRVNKGAQKAN